MTAEEEENHFTEDFDFDELPYISVGGVKDWEKDRHKAALAEIPGAPVRKEGNGTTAASPNVSQNDTQSVDTASDVQECQSLERVSACEESSPVHVAMCFNDDGIILDFEGVLEDSDPEFCTLPDIRLLEKLKLKAKVPQKKIRTLKCPQNVEYIFKNNISKTGKLDETLKNFYQLKDCFTPLVNLKHSWNGEKLKKYKWRTSLDYVNSSVVDKVKGDPKKKKNHKEKERERKHKEKEKETKHNEKKKNDKHPLKMHKTPRCDSTEKRGSLRDHNSSKGSSTKLTDDSPKLSTSKENQHRKTVFNYDSFKVYSCKIKNCKQDEFCIYYHSALDRRRSTKKYNYTPVLCKEISLKKLSKCPKGDNCKLSHTDIEIKYHPWFYKKIPCKKFLEDKCPKGDFCIDNHKAASELLGPVESPKQVISKPGAVCLKDVQEGNGVGNLLEFEEENEWDRATSNFDNGRSINFDDSLQWSVRCKGTNGCDEPSSHDPPVKISNGTNSVQARLPLHDVSLIFGRPQKEKYVVNQNSGQNLDTKAKVLNYFERMMKVKEFLRTGLGEKMTLWFSKIKKMDPNNPNLSGKPFIFGLAKDDNISLVKNIVADLHGLRNMDYPTYILADIREALNVAKILQKNIISAISKLRYYGLDLDLVAKATLGKDLNYIIARIQNEIDIENNKVSDHVIVMLYNKVMERQRKMKCRSTENIQEHQSQGRTGTQDDSEGLHSRRKFNNGDVWQPTGSEVTLCNTAVQNSWQSGAADTEDRSSFFVDPLPANGEEYNTSHLSSFVRGSDCGFSIAKKQTASFSQELHGNPQSHSYARPESVTSAKNDCIERDVGSTVQPVPQSMLGFNTHIAHSTNKDSMGLATHCNAAVQNSWQSGAADTEDRSAFSANPLPANGEEYDNSHLSSFVRASDCGLSITKKQIASFSQELHGNQQSHSYTRLENATSAKNDRMERDVGSTVQPVPQSMLGFNTNIARSANKDSMGLATHCNAAVQNSWQSGVADTEDRSTFSADPLPANGEEYDNSHLPSFVRASDCDLSIAKKQTASLSQELHGNQQSHAYARLESVTSAKNDSIERDVTSTSQTVPQSMLESDTHVTRSTNKDSMGLATAHETPPQVLVVSQEPQLTTSEPDNIEVFPGSIIYDIFRETQSRTEPDIYDYVKHFLKYMGFGFNINLITSVCRQVIQIRRRKATNLSCGVNSHLPKNGTIGPSNTELGRISSKDIEEVLPSLPSFAGKTSRSDNKNLGSPNADLAIPLLFPPSSLNIPTEDILRGMDWEIPDVESCPKQEASSQNLSRIPPSLVYTLKSPEYTCESPEVRIISPTYSPRPKRRLSSPADLRRSVKLKRRIRSPEYSPKSCKVEKLSPIFLTQKTNIRRTPIECIEIPSSPEYVGN